MLNELNREAAAKRGAPGSDIISAALANNRLGVSSVVFFGVAGAAPLTARAPS